MATRSTRNWRRASVWSGCCTCPGTPTCSSRTIRPTQRVWRARKKSRRCTESCTPVAGSGSHNGSRRRSPDHLLDRLAVRIHQLGVPLFETPALVARRVHPARSPHAAGTAAVDARRRADVAQDGADPLVERRVAAAADLQPAEPLLDLSRSPGRPDTGALQGQQDRQAPAQEMVPAGSVDRADDRHVGVALASLDRPARVCRRRAARVYQVGEVLGADQVLEDPV